MPVIAVLPLQKPSVDPEQAYCANWITEDLIADLSGLRVVAQAKTVRWPRSISNQRMRSRPPLDAFLKVLDATGEAVRCLLAQGHLRCRFSFSIAVVRANRW